MRGPAPVAAIGILELLLFLLFVLMGAIMSLVESGDTYSGMEMLMIHPDSYIDSEKGILYLHLENRGKPTVKIYKVETCFENLAGSTLNYAFVPGPGTEPQQWRDLGTDVHIVLRASEEAWLAIKLAKSYTPGTVCDVKLFTAAGNVYTAMLTVK